MKSYTKDYPRPQLVRGNWTNLNGSWDFAFDDENSGERGAWYCAFPEKHRKIQVPFACETEKSGIGEHEHHENVWYHRTFSVDGRELSEKKILLHFEGSDFLTKIWVNGAFVGSHRGGYARFSFDITRYVKPGENALTVKAEDSVSLEQPRGKQRWMPDNFACWYVQTTGIWKTVWMEAVPQVFLSDIKITPDMTAGSVCLEYRIAGDVSSKDCTVESEVEFDGTLINRSAKQAGSSRVEDTVSVMNPTESPSGIHPWSPESPNLYDLCIRIRKDGSVIDEVRSYFGMRDIRIEAGNILLNGSPLYQRLILDQGYWEESHLTPPDEQALIDDIDKLQAMGYNGVRKHMKIEDERFLYWCDVKGMLVWSEMAAAFRFTDKAIAEYTKEWLEAVRQNYSHPSIISWTPFNESWGIPDVKTDRKQQSFTESIYYLTKSIDSMRPVVVNDGWEHTVSDILTLHDYEEDGDRFFNRYYDHLGEITDCEIYHNRNRSAMAEGFAYKGQPVIISEYGGIAFAGGKEGEWGYGKAAESEEEFLTRFDRITTAIRKIPYIVGYCYTQVSDVQQEINGLLNERHEYKIAPEKIKEINCRQIGTKNNDIENNTRRHHKDESRRNCQRREIFPARGRRRGRRDS